MSKAITHLHLSQNLNRLNRTEGGPRTKASRGKYLNTGKKKILITRQKSPQKTDFTLSVQSFAIKLPQTHENLGEKRFINATICLHGKDLK